MLVLVFSVSEGCQHCSSMLLKSNTREAADSIKKRQKGEKHKTHKSGHATTQTESSFVSAPTGCLNMRPCVK